MSKSVKLILEGLNCAGCAGKIEKYSNELQGVKATLNFTTKELSLDIEGNIEENVDKIKKIVKDLEPDVVVKLKNENDFSKPIVQKHSLKEELKKPKNIQTIIGAVILIAAVLYSTVTVIAIPLFIISYILIGRDVVFKALKNMSKGRVFDENFLMTIATIGAFIIGEYPEAVAVMLFYKIGEAVQDVAVNKSRASITSLMDIRPDYATLFSMGIEKRVTPDKVKVGDIIIVKPGEKIPLDGVVIEGEGAVDTTALTGESVPRDVSSGENVLSGFINKTSLLKIKVEKEFAESTVSKILNLVENASNKKSKTENFITKFARYYTPIVVVIAAFLSILPPIFLGDDFSTWIYRGLSFLVVSCPCALVISIPLSYFGGIGGASRRGILIKGGNYLDVLKSLDTVIFDKTGTLTKGNFKVTDIKALRDYNEEDILMYSAYAESNSNHPIARSIVDKYNSEINKENIEYYTEIPGKGIETKINEKVILAGNIKLIKDREIDIKDIDNLDVVGTIVYLAIDNKLAGYIVISDELKEDSIEAIQKIKSIGVKETIMLTGDNRKVALKIGAELGIDSIYSDLLPQNKVEVFEKVSEGKVAAFVGDGINDAPTLARADIGIAMGGLGSDAAIEAADIVIMTDEVSKVAEAIDISKLTSKIVMQNIGLALGIKGIVLILVTFGMSTMWEAVFADVGVTLLAVLNSMRVLKAK